MATLLSVNNYYYYRGGAETVFLEQNRLFEEAGWNVVPFCMKHSRNLPTKWSKTFVNEVEFGEKYSWLGRLSRGSKAIYSFEARHKLARLIDETKPDICHAHNIYHHISPSILSLLKQKSIPIVLTLHDLKIACPAYNMLAPDGICERCRNGRLYNVVLHRCIKHSATLSAVVMLEAVLHRLLGSYSKCVNCFIVPSRFYLEKFCEWGWPRSLFKYVPNFVDASRHQPQYEPGNSFVYCGRVSHEKGLETLIRATAAARVRACIVGTGPQLDYLQKLALQLNADVTFLGYLTGNSLRDAIRGARAVVVPSEWYENAPLSVLEAYALGKPVIGARIGGIPELLREGETGVGFVSGDSDALAATLISFADRSTADIEAMGRTAREWVEHEFTPALYLKRIGAIYQELGAIGMDPQRRQTHNTP